MESEKKPLQKMGKQLVAARALPAGHVLAQDDIAIKSPGGGLPPYRMDDVIGKKTRVALSEDDPIPADLLN
jgi:N-acetylneuraminate synthase/sialic acid synthase